MNTYPIIPPQGAVARALPRDRTVHDDVDFVSFFRTLSDARWLIIGTTLLALLVGAAYVIIGRPIYQSDILIQVEQSQQNGAVDSSVLGQLNTAFNVQSSTSAEIEILRSRLVIGKAVDALNLSVTASPRYIPIIGTWMARHATQLSDPGLFGHGGYVSGTETIKVGELEVPNALLGQALTLTATATGYDLRGPQGLSLASGRVGVMTPFSHGGGRILVKELHAKPGAEFTVMRQSRQDAVKSLQGRLQIAERGKPSGVLAASLQGTDPVEISRVLNTIGDSYARQNVERKAAEAEKSLTFLDHQLPQLKDQMDKAESEYTNFRDKHGTFDLSTEGNLSLTASATLQTQLFELEQKRRELASQYTSAFPLVQVIDKQIAALHDQIAKMDERIKSLPDLQQKLANLTRNVKVSSDLYASLLNSEQQLQLVKEGKVGNVRVVDSAVASRHPVRPNGPVALAIAGTAGVLLGVLLALLRKWRHPGLRYVDDIEMNLGLSVFATIPHSSAQARVRLQAGDSVRSRLLALRSPDDPALESLRSLRTTLQFALHSAANNIVILTGPTANVGKTFVSANFAALLGAAGKRVLLIDADMRGGGLHESFNVNPNTGLSELIAGDIELSEALHENITPNVDFIATGMRPARPAEMLLAPQVGELLQDMSARYDVVLLDTTPLLPVSDTLALTPLAGTVFMVARTQLTTLAELQETAKRIYQSGSQIKGVIFNDLVATNAPYGKRYSGRTREEPIFPALGN